jgi:hypothetical protein
MVTFTVVVVLVLLLFVTNASVVAATGLWVGYVSRGEGGCCCGVK